MKPGERQLPHLFGAGGAAGPELRVSWPSSDAGERHAGCVHSHGGTPLSGPLRPAGDRRGGPAHLAVSLPPLHPGCRKRNRSCRRETINPGGRSRQCASSGVAEAGRLMSTPVISAARLQRHGRGSARPSPGKAPKEVRRTETGYPADRSGNAAVWNHPDAALDKGRREMVKWSKFHITWNGKSTPAAPLREPWPSAGSQGGVCARVGSASGSEGETPLAASRPKVRNQSGTASHGPPLERNKGRVFFIEWTR